VPTAEDVLSLAVLLARFSRRVVGWSMADHLRAARVVGAVEMAVWNRRPARGVMHHCDHGGHSTALLFGHHCQDVGIRCTGGLGRRLL
jgi:putative transposase